MIIGENACPDVCFYGRATWKKKLAHDRATWKDKSWWAGRLGHVEGSGDAKEEQVPRVESAPDPILSSGIKASVGQRHFVKRSVPYVQSQFW
jgi:hypothetical protein